MTETPSSLRLGIAGLGTVGRGLVRIIEDMADLLSARAGRRIVIRAVSARTRKRDRGIDLSPYAWCDNPVDLAALDDVDAVVELIGGGDGPALALARETLGRGKAFVTANKALIAAHGATLAALAEKNGAPLRFEAAVAGGIPVIKALREGLAGNRVGGLYGILNGTCNYILTRMEEEGLAFDDVLADAQRLGYAEADPTFDIDGIDTAHKTAILAALAFGCAPDMDAVPCEGIRSIAPVDIDYASELGYRIKLLGIARKTAKGLETRVYPAMVPLASPLAQVGGALNAVVIAADPVGQTVYEGFGAGEGPTASAVAADIIDIARGLGGPPLGVPAARLETPVSIPREAHEGRFYMRLRVEDRPGVMADITAGLARAGVSIESLLQRGAALNGGVYVVLTTHMAVEAAVAEALTLFRQLDSVLESPTMIRVEGEPETPA
ncbi:homoserine dehydrogenase [Eilatimonas milleporae]|uniref:Homoserine dehydrogenase n=1 Tax=Eilatimonas milleporae TaxID=911205 RepID=A0A3M0C5A6_9PROT|nr:homoserine dehydrogenase [Eilatimonas milleporae]RMB05031.1 homoserine dehydrogenase [Eilatimonas milleporae]